MQMTRRKLFGFAAAAAASLLVPELAMSTKSIFLPPKGGWVQLPYASLIIPRAHAEDFYASEIASGIATYDADTEMMSWWRAPGNYRAKVWPQVPFVGLDELGNGRVLAQRLYRV